MAKGVESVDRPSTETMWQSGGPHCKSLKWVAWPALVERKGLRKEECQYSARRGLGQRRSRSRSQRNHHPPGGDLHHCNLCHRCTSTSRSPSVWRAPPSLSLVPLRQNRQWHKSVRGEEGERDGRTAPRRRNPAGDKVFFKHYVFANICPHFLFPGGKYIVRCILQGYHSFHNHHVNRALVLETCCER